MRICLVLLFFVAGIAHLQAQTLKAYEKAANEAFEKEEYYNAVYYYELVLKSKKKPGIYYNYAEACRLSYAYKKAETAYQNVAASDQAGGFDKLDFYLGLTLKHNGKYEEAASAFQRFLDQSPTGYHLQKAQQELASCALAQELAQNPIDSIEIERLGDQINTEFSDFGAHEMGEDSLMYSSLRFERKPGKEEKKPDSKLLISKLLLAKDTASRGRPVAGLNINELHSANSCLSPDGLRLYFTRCTGNRADSIVCKVYMARKLENGRWSKPYKMPAPLNMPGSSTTQPSMAVEEGEEWIYYASNRKGSKGGFDLYRSPMWHDTLAGPAEQLPDIINSIEDEATPFYHVETQTLYFASKWHLGMGGFDIFKSIYDKEGNSWSAPENLGVPVNSAANDLYWWVHSNDSTGYFASNRAGSKTITEESCCNDIYKFTLENSLTPLDTPVVDTPDTNVVVVVDHPGDPTPGEDLIEELNNMLPIQLYFHNDEPDSNTTVKFTDQPYQLPYEHYITLQDRYVKEHAGQFSGNQKDQVTQKINTFFTNEVKGEYNRMNDFFDGILKLLENGIPLEVQLKGYTSPRSPEGYNLSLAHRRIASVRKQFFIYKKGVFLQYFQKGLLTVRELPIGELQSPPGISDAINDPKNSIFSVEASQERRAEIVVLERKVE